MPGGFLIKIGLIALAIYLVLAEIVDHGGDLDDLRDRVEAVE